LLLAGIVLFVMSLVAGPISAKDYKLPAFGRLARLVIGCLGVTFMGLSARLYSHPPTKDPTVMAPFDLKRPDQPALNIAHPVHRPEAKAEEEARRANGRHP